MRGQWIAVGVLLLAPAACSDAGPTEPADEAVVTRISVEIDWPLAREPWFLATGWKVTAPDPNWSETCDTWDYNCPHNRPWIEVGDGPFPPGGVAEASFLAKCEPGEALRDADVAVSGLRKSAGQGLHCPYCACTPGLPLLQCTESLQRLTVPSDSTFENCAAHSWVETDVVLRLDWEYARKPTFEGARWRLLERRTYADRYGLRWAAVDTGTFPEDGIAEVALHTFCEPGDDPAFDYLNHRVEVSGHFIGYEEAFPDPECRLVAWNFRCTSEPQVRTLFHSPQPFTDPPAQCTPPPEG